MFLAVGCNKSKQASSQPTKNPTSQPTNGDPMVAAPKYAVTTPADKAPAFALGAYQGETPLGYSSVGAIWTVDFDGAFLLAVEPKTGKLLGQAKTWPRPHDVYVSSDGKWVWVSAVGVEDDAGEGGADTTSQPTGNDDGEIWVYNAETLEVAHKLRPGRYPGHLAIRPDGQYMFASLAGDNAVAVIDVKQMKVLGKIPVGASPRGLAVSPDGKHLAVACSKENVVSIIDLTTLTREYEIEVGGRPTQIAFSHDSHHFYVTVLDDNKFKAFDIDSRSFLWDLNVSYGMGHLTVSTKTGNIYLADTASNSLLVIDPKEKKQIVSQYTGNGAHAVALSPDEATIYVSNGIDRTVSEVTSENKEKVLPTEGFLRGIAVGLAPKKASIATNVTPVAVKPQPKVDDAKVRYGRSVFKKYCDACHPQGKQKIGPQIKGKGFSRKRIINQVRNGSDIMPGFDAEILSAGDLEAIVAYLQAP
jgi:YVTN family beta-propeller protein